MLVAMLQAAGCIGQTGQPSRWHVLANGAGGGAQAWQPLPLRAPAGSGAGT
jgi:hypothetical protein